MNAEIIAVGSEMLTPSRVDTNSLYLTAELNNLGVEVVAKCVIGDDRARLTEAIRGAIGRSPVVLISGGLGPTEDDLTRDAVAGALGRQLVFQPAVAEALEARFSRSGRQMAAINKRQAYLVEGAELLPNDRGTAPGQWIATPGSVIALLPGPPHELKRMFELQCLPRLRRLAPQLAIRTVFLRVAGFTESDLDQLIAPIYTKYQNPVTTVLAAPGDIQVHLRARCATAEEAETLAREVADPIEKLLGDCIYSRDGSPLEAAVGKLLEEAGATLAVAESCTGGALGEQITSAPGSSRYFLGGFLTYTDAIKQQLLGVPPDMLAQHTAVSPEVAEAMARGARERTGATYALSVTGIAGPEGGSDAKPVGTVCLGLAYPGGTLSLQRRFYGDRIRVRANACQTALDTLRRHLLGLAPRPM